MARLNVNPTRMQLKALKERLKIAVRGHKLLKDKSDEMIRRFTIFVKENYALRQQIEEEIRENLKQFCVAKSFMSEKEVLSTFALPVSTFSAIYGESSIMSIPTPDIKIVEEIGSNSLPYSYISTNGQLDIIVKSFKNLMPKIVKLANLEKTCQVLSNEIERTKRRVNALEFVMIPQLEETIKYITMKIEENDRSSIIRLIKVKSMIEKRNV